MSVRYKPAIHFNHVDFSFSKTPILKGITGSFPEGKITTLVGPSGAGKTTLLKLCNGLLSAQSGEVYIKDQPIESYEPVELRRSVGIALQSAPMITGSVYENLSLPLELQGESLSKAEAVELLEDVGLEEELMERKVKDLSGGQRQKVSIARTLVNKPAVLLLDEITSSLDRTSLREIEELIVKINRKYGTAIIWITHNLQQALEIGDYTWVMMDGEVVETGESDLLNDPVNDKVRQFVTGEAE
ncbi:phosphate import ATP-binding protein pstB 1 [Planococcus antarcticus DSM 14505]|uniref:Phosphate ABC transporter ATP-binding protein n=1 Tax=Planococcus antarcticus DSM 14505 TaxID=1185653 RepID=A0A1C7DC55_9BACL|nr:phosphate ABC transporter ATP-binding protein [Planococcus antarcticus]ANU09089.1 phosphate ABC transporter ATP-binding protein [Planococcus antarcticus DSM 14505]EIM08571.1 phosphate import ATP-binding protein pstB 1 [Planococcus antarcticus DSM 14505]